MKLYPYALPLVAATWPADGRWAILGGSRFDHSGVRR